MENQVFRLGADASLLLKDDTIWMLNKKINSVEKFEKELNKTGLMKTRNSNIPLSSIQKVIVNSSAESTKVEYINDNDKIKKENLEFNSKSISDDFGHFLGSKLALSKSKDTENQIKPLLLNLLYLAIAVAFTIFFAMMDDTSQITDSNSRRNSGARAILKMIVDTLGQTGTLIIGSLISLCLLYKLYKRFTNPGQVTTYSK